MSPLDLAPDYAAANERTLMRSLLREIEDALRKLEDIHARYPQFRIEWRDGFCHARGDTDAVAAIASTEVSNPRIVAIMVRLFWQDHIGRFRRVGLKGGAL